jgi:hypothetical protein
MEKAKTELSGGSHHPDSIFLEDNTVVSWASATAEMRAQWLLENGHGRSPNGEPDKGNGKGERKKNRRSRPHA